MLKADASWPHLPGTGRNEIEVVPRGIRQGHIMHNHAPPSVPSLLVTQSQTTPWPPTCSGALPTWCTIEVAPLLAFTVDAAIQDAPGA